MNENLPMTVLFTDKEGKTEAVCINVLDVDFIENKGRRFVYHIGEKVYYQITMKTEMEDILEANGFDILDRPYLVNMKKIHSYDEQLGKVYFVPEPNNSNKFATVARIKKEFVDKTIRRIVSHNNNRTTEITIGKSSGSILQRLIVREK